MILTCEPRIIELPINERLQDDDFRIHRMWIEALPYRDGGHCTFFAVQEAMINFNKTALKSEDLRKFEQERRKIVNAYKIRTGKENELGAHVKLSLPFIFGKLHKAGIVPENIKGSSDTIRMLAQMDELDNYKPIMETIRGNKLHLPDELPALLFLEREDGPHVWFCEDIDTYHKELLHHKRPTDKFVLVSKLKRE